MSTVTSLRTGSGRAERAAGRGTAGFTLIELLIVVVIIGILAAIAIPQFASTKEKAFDASAKSDLRNLMTAEESYFYDYNSYSAGSQSGAGAPIKDANGSILVRASNGISGGVSVQGRGYVATAGHDVSSSWWCVNTDDGAGHIVQTSPGSGC
jgi:prepilin-type N-terminal cleavage/methylation domain-containing protein